MRWSVVDVQNDFCPGGALAVVDGDQVVPVLNRYIDIFTTARLPDLCYPRLASRKDQSFKDYGGPWPVHCVQGTTARSFIRLCAWAQRRRAFKRHGGGRRQLFGIPSTDRPGHRWQNLLRRKGVERIFVGGLATDYCVKQTVLDGLKQGFKVVLLGDAIRAVNLSPDDGAAAIDEMVRAGAVRVDDIA